MLDVDFAARVEAHHPELAALLALDQHRFRAVEVGVVQVPETDGVAGKVTNRHRRYARQPRERPRSALGSSPSGRFCASLVPPERSRALCSVASALASAVLGEK